MVQGILRLVSGYFVITVNTLPMYVASLSALYRFYASVNIYDNWRMQYHALVRVPWRPSVAVV